MIKNLFSSGPYIVSDSSDLRYSGGGSYLPSTPDPIYGLPGIGDVRLNPATGQLEAWTGTGCWITITGTANIGLTQQAVDILNWAKKKMEEETKLLGAVNNNPAVADAYAAYEDAADKLKVILSLTQENQ